MPRPTASGAVHLPTLEDAQMFLDTVFGLGGRGIAEAVSECGAVDLIGQSEHRKICSQEPPSESRGKVKTEAQSNVAKSEGHAIVLPGWCASP